MGRQVIARVAIEKSTLRFDRLFDYIVPEAMADQVKPGCRVLVPFGRANRKMQALVFALTDSSEYERGCKAVFSLLDKEP
jgi:primosomal protein N' (replication factor Y)